MLTSRTPYPPLCVHIPARASAIQKCQSSCYFCFLSSFTSKSSKNTSILLSNNLRLRSNRFTKTATTHTHISNKTSKCLTTTTLNSPSKAAVASSAVSPMQLVVWPQVSVALLLVCFSSSLAFLCLRPPILHLSSRAICSDES